MKPHQRAIRNYLVANSFRLREGAVEVYDAYIEATPEADIFDVNVVVELLGFSNTAFDVMAEGDEAKMSWAEAESVRLDARTGRIDPFKAPLLQNLTAAVDALWDDPARPTRLHGEGPATTVGQASVRLATTAARHVLLARRDLYDVRVHGAMAWGQAAHMAEIDGEGPGHADEWYAAHLLANEVVTRIAWLMECQQAGGLVIGPVSQRKWGSGADAAMSLRLWADQLPELRASPALGQHAPQDPAEWLTVRDYATLPMPEPDEEMVDQFVRDAFEKRRYVHDHTAIIEVDRKPVKRLILAPERFNRTPRTVSLYALIEHVKGTFPAYVEVSQDGSMRALTIPHGNYAWRAAYTARQFVVEMKRHYPCDAGVRALMIAAWRDLVVPRVREQQYESKVVRKAKQATIDDRAVNRNRHAIVHYLPRTVVVRRMEAAERASGNGQRATPQAYRVGVFARRLPPGQQRSERAQEYADSIGMPLPDDCTCVQPHIRGGTEEERQMMLAQDDVRLWRSWSAIDLLGVTR